MRRDESLDQFIERMAEEGRQFYRRAQAEHARRIERREARRNPIGMYGQVVRRQRQWARINEQIFQMERDERALEDLAAQFNNADRARRRRDVRAQAPTSHTRSLHRSTPRFDPYS